MDGVLVARWEGIGISGLRLYEYSMVEGAKR
jgi:hypothetical protein